MTEQDDVGYLGATRAGHLRRDGREPTDQDLREPKAEEPPELVNRIRMTRRHDLAKFCERNSPDDIRRTYVLHAVRYNADRNEFAASDGKLLAISKVDGWPAPHSVSIPAETFDELDWPREGLDLCVREENRTRVELRRDKRYGDGLVAEAKQPEGRLWAYSKCIPTDDPAEFICVDAELLAKVANHAAENCGRPGEICLRIEFRGHDRALVFHAYDRQSRKDVGFSAYLMPLTHGGPDDK